MSGYIAPQQPIQPQPPLQPVYQEEKGLTVCGIVGVVFGALGFVLSFIPIINNIAAIFGFIGVILAIVALVGTFRGKKRGKALAIVAAVLSVLAIVHYSGHAVRSKQGHRRGHRRVKLTIIRKRLRKKSAEGRSGYGRRFEDHACENRLRGT